MTTMTTTLVVLIFAMLLDAVLGEPKWLWSRLPHPAVLMGRLVGALEARLNHGDRRKQNGIWAVVVLVLVGLCVGWALAAFGPVISCLVAAILIAQNSLCAHVMDVAKGLRSSLPDGRKAVSMIVSRDTDEMTGPQVARSAIESGAENFSDGVIAPVFWFLVGGLPGLIIYKLVNTADSMIGYRTERYEQFGWAAARLDDVLNVIPARLSSALIAMVTGHWREGDAVAKDAALHRSPNAGWPEAAMARAIGVALAGPRSYDGEMRPFPWVNAAGSKSSSARDVARSVTVLWTAWGAVVVLLVAFAALLSLG
ncbi:cobalamin biosynthesis protein [Tritonibacter multivorans]|uniref:Cobalamin biosynthesis protein CobD n=2 Tax=Tritonibacter multivorans TaxID=928856 RepID=A0A0P1GC88_9RHOB|nr:cobalamin biosynthesis protein [Tritonibacter multivorans]SFD27007.1 adenosylcobinamide-phosphate synthase [Tritonibacter multivorans]